MNYSALLKMAKIFKTASSKLEKNRYVTLINSEKYHTDEDAVKFIEEIKPYLDNKENIIINLDGAETTTTGFLKLICKELVDNYHYGIHNTVKFLSPAKPYRAEKANKYVQSLVKLPIIAQDIICKQCGHAKSKHIGTTKINKNGHAVFCGTQCCTELVQTGGFREPPKECPCRNFLI